MSLEPYYLKVLFQVSVSAEEKRAAGIVLAAAASAAACGVCCFAGVGGRGHFLDSGLTGCVKPCVGITCVAPIEQRRLQQQLCDIVETGGFEPQSAGRWAGNLISCVRYIPTQLCNAAFKHRVQGLIPRGLDKRKEPTKFFAVWATHDIMMGAFTGCFVYPLEVAHTLLALDTLGAYRGSWDCLTTVIAANGGGLAGLRVLMSGFKIYAIGIIPFRCCYIGVNEALSSFNPYKKESSSGHGPYVVSRFCCSQVAGIVAVVASYPLNSVCRTMQVHAAAGSPTTTSDACADVSGRGAWFAGLGMRCLAAVGYGLVVTVYKECCSKPSSTRDRASERSRDRECRLKRQHSEDESRELVCSSATASLGAVVCWSSDCSTSHKRSKVKVHDGCHTGIVVAISRRNSCVRVRWADQAARGTGCDCPICMANKDGEEVWDFGVEEPYRKERGCAADAGADPLQWLIFIDKERKLCPPPVAATAAVVDKDSSSLAATKAQEREEAYKAKLDAAGWEMCTDDQGDVFYYNRNTDESDWDPPFPPDGSAAEPAAPASAPARAPAPAPAPAEPAPAEPEPAAASQEPEPVKAAAPEPEAEPTAAAELSTADLEAEELAKKEAGKLNHQEEIARKAAETEQAAKEKAEKAEKMTAEQHEQVAQAVKAGLSARAPPRAPPRAPVVDAGHSAVSGGPPDHSECPPYNSAFVFLKPHAATEPAKTLVKAGLEEKGYKILAEGELTGSVIDSKQLIDNHYYSIASKATILDPSELNVPADKFEAKFGIGWEEALGKGVVFNARQACKKMRIDGAALDKKWAAARKSGALIKFGGGFYCALIDDMYIFNGFFMEMRDKYTGDAKLNWFVVEWDETKTSWADFRGTGLGWTDPADASPASLRGQIAASWQSLGLPGPCDVGDNGVHASASPFEAMAERCNWLRSTHSISTDPFGKAAIAAGVPESVLAEWSVDPQVKYNGSMSSLFDLVEDLDSSACIAKLVDIYAPAPAPQENEVDDFEGYMKRVGLEAWVAAFQKNLPQNCESIARVRKTTRRDLVKLGYKLTAAHVRSVLGALRKEPLATELGSAAVSAPAAAPRTPAPAPRHSLMVSGAKPLAGEYICLPTAQAQEGARNLSVWICPSSGFYLHSNSAVAADGNAKHTKWRFGLEPQLGQDPANRIASVASTTARPTASGWVSRQFNGIEQGLRMAELEKPFTDDEFPPLLQSLYFPRYRCERRGLFSSMVWKRAAEIWPDCEVIADGISAGDVKQGKVGDCFLMAALAAMATQPSSIERLLVTKTRSDSGKYVVKLWLTGRPVEVTVDDWLPVLDDKPAFCCSKSEQGELWPCLLEKAWVKQHGSYNNADGGTAYSALSDLTGFPVAKVLSGDEDFTERLLEALDKKWLVATLGVHSDVDSRIVERVIGVYKGHAYSILSHHHDADDAADTGDAPAPVDPSRVWLKMRNPHAEQEQLSDWAAHTHSAAPTLSEAESADGVFYIPVNTFRKWFSGVCICHYRGATWQHEAVTVAVRPEPQKGRGKTLAERASDYSYATLTIERKTDLIISASQISERDPMRPTTESRYLPVLSLSLWSGAQAECIKRVETPIHDGPYRSARNLSMELSLEPGDYVVVLDALVTQKEAALWHSSTNNSYVPITLSAVFDGDLELRVPHHSDSTSTFDKIIKKMSNVLPKLGRQPPLYMRDRDFFRASWNFGFENILIRVKVEMNSSSNELTRTFTAAGHEERAWDFDGLYLVPLYKKARGFFRRDERLQFFRVNTRDGSKSSDEMSDENGGYDRVLFWDSRHCRWCLALTYFYGSSHDNAIVKRCFVLPVGNKKACGWGSADASVEDPRSRYQRYDIDAMRHSHTQLLGSAADKWSVCDALGFDFDPLESGTSAVKSVQITQLSRREAAETLGRWGVQRNWEDHSFTIKGAPAAAAAAAAASSQGGGAIETDEVRAYMRRVGLDAWWPYFEKHLPANIKSIRRVRATTAADLRRMATKANMKLDAATTQKVLDALKKP